MMSESGECEVNGRRSWKDIGVLESHAQVDLELNSRFVSYYNVRFLACGDVRTIFSCRNRARFKCTFQVSVFEPKDKSYFDVKESGAHNHEFDRSQTQSKPVHYVAPESRAPPRFKHRVEAVNQGASTSHSPAPIEDNEEDCEWLSNLLSEHRTNPSQDCSILSHKRSVLLPDKSKMTKVVNDKRLNEYLNGISVDPDYRIESHSFQQDLNAFYRKKWGQIVAPGKVNGHPLDLYALYKSVTSRGGFLKVTHQDLWMDVADDLQLPYTITGASFGVQSLYMRYLSKYEQVNLLTIEEDERDTRGPRTRTFICTLVDQPVKSCDNERNRLLPTPVRAPPYQPLLRSLQSGLANEVNFSINVCMLLSHPGPKYLRLTAQPGLIDAILFTIGIVPEESLFTYKPEELPKFPWKSLTDKDENFACHVSKTEWSRLVQVMTVFRNLSFEPINKRPLAQSKTIRRLLSLCLDCKLSQIKNMSMDLMSNIALEMDISPIRDLWTQDLLSKLLREFKSGDKAAIIRSMETIAGLCMVENNESVMMEFIGKDMVDSMRDMLYVKDVMLSVYTLECMYYISELGPDLCQIMAHTDRLIDVLVTLATIEAHSFGARGLAGMKVVEYGPPQAHTAMLHVPPNRPLPPNQRPIMSPMGPPMVPPPNMATMAPPRVPSPIQSPIHISPTSVQTVPTVKQNDDCDVREDQVELLTTNWLKCNCRPEPGHSVRREELYAVYVKNMHSNHNTFMALGANPFANLIRKVFPSTTQRNTDSGGSKFIDGLKLAGNVNTPANSFVSNHMKPRSIISSSPSSPLVQQILNRPVTASHTNNNHVPRPGSGAASPESLVSSPSPKSDSCQGVRPSPVPQDEPLKGHKCVLERCHEPQEAATVVDGHETKIVRVHNTALVNGHKSPEPELKHPVKRLNGVKEHVQINSVHSMCNGHNKVIDLVPKSYDEQSNINGNSMKSNISASDLKNNCKSGSGKLADNLDDIPPPPPPVPLRLDDIPPPPPPQIKQVIPAVTLKRPLTPSSSDKSDISIAPPSAKRPHVGPAPVCQWNMCDRQFDTVNQLIVHTTIVHACDDRPVACAWPHCDVTPRFKWSLVTHVQDVHCNSQALLDAFGRREGKPDVPTVKTPPAHPGYSRTAAIDAIRRHALAYLTPEVTDEPEGPVTRCLRLTSSLVLRNIARYSHDGRSLLRRHESHLCWLALSRLQCGQALAQCLAELHQS